jgi:hypothetical protein
MNIHLTPSSRRYWITDRRYFSMQDEKKFMNCMLMRAILTYTVFKK